MKSLLYIFPILVCLSCDDRPSADTIYYNGFIYTMDTTFSVAEALAIHGDTFMNVGSFEEVMKMKGEKTKIVDLEERFVMPGFIEGHGHFAALGRSKIQLNLMKTRSWQEVERLVRDRIENSSPLWITGHGWHQDKWDSLPEMHFEGYPNRLTMDSLSSDRPVMLIHASGHSLFANSTAMKRAGISIETPDPQGGRIVRDASGQPIGIFEETAMTLITQSYRNWYDSLTLEEQRQIELKEIRMAERACLENGITSFQDAGSKYHHVNLYRELSENDSLDVRLWVMLRDSFRAMEPHMNELPYIRKNNPFFTCRAIKSEIDGALGSYGAWLLEPYSDKPGFYGQNTTNLEEVRRIAQLAKNHEMQLCVHAIGDKGNQVILDMMNELIGPDGSSFRWRIEHAQHLHPNDIPRFSKLGIIASMQSVHCTSDAPFVVKRLGQQRAKEGAYVWKSLLNHDAVVSNGTDAPVEDVDPIPNLYAAVTRRRTDNGLVFFKEQAISREQALYSMTMACAYAGFEEEVKGSIEKGKLADFIVVNTNLATCDEQEILDADVLATYVGGILKYEKP